MAHLRNVSWFQRADKDQKYNRLEVDSSPRQYVVDEPPDSGNRSGLEIASQGIRSSGRSNRPSNGLRDIDRNRQLVLSTVDRLVLSAAKE